MNATERREFVGQHRTCVVGYTRRQGPPSLSIVYYALDGDEIVFSTMAGRQKAKAVERVGELSLCILDEQWPPTYLVVYGQAELDHDIEHAVDMAMVVGEIMAGHPIPEAARPLIRESCQREQRVVVRVKPESTFHSPPVHLNREDDLNDAQVQKKMQHGYGARLPW